AQLANRAIRTGPSFSLFTLTSDGSSSDLLLAHSRDSGTHHDCGMYWRPDRVNTSSLLFL
ncbi:hypothetical protein, partial [Klebsiella pneumoniae]|uniref:hypothetical protein n=1 Tax=Klebsiella pneumoniae TaxID=573 RepID=UPI0019688B73